MHALSKPTSISVLIPLQAQYSRDVLLPSMYVFHVMYRTLHVSPSLSFILLFPSAVPYKRCARKYQKLKNKPTVPDRSSITVGRLTPSGAEELEAFEFTLALAVLIVRMETL